MLQNSQFTINIIVNIKYLSCMDLCDLNFVLCTLVYLTDIIQFLKLFLLILYYSYYLRVNHGQMGKTQVMAHKVYGSIPERSQQDFCGVGGVKFLV